MIIVGDALQSLKSMPDGSVNCGVTSPPYYGLRDYGVAGQIGLEETPAEYISKLVAIFHEFRRVLRDDGTLWVNIADSYAGGGRGCDTPKQRSNAGTVGMPKSVVPSGCKPKDLIGIPWKLAEALKSPYYSGRIKNELDRVWLAAMIDAEGSICGFVHTRKDDGSIRTGVSICITNSDDRILQKAFSIYPLASRHAHQKNGDGHLGNRDIWRWYVFGIEAKQYLLREIYPYLVAKRKQAIIAYNFLEYQKRAKQYGHTAQKQEVLDLREKMMRDISSLNHGIDIDIPSWMSEPPSLYVDGWYLRQEIIWSKPNPMPESVTDRCTKSHESIFLFAKSAQYYFDGRAIAEPVAETTVTRLAQNIDAQHGSDRVQGKTNGTMKAAAPRYGVVKYTEHPEIFNRTKSGNAYDLRDKRNKRDVWKISTTPFSGAHFATFPKKLIEPCILAGCPKGGTVCDMFCGSGTTGVVAYSHQREFIGIEIKPEYAKIAERRISEETNWQLNWIGE